MNAWALSLNPFTRFTHKNQIQELNEHWTLNTEHTHDMRYVLIYNLKTEQWSDEASICLNETQYDTRAQVYRTPVSKPNIQMLKCLNDYYYYFILQSHNKIIIVCLCVSLNRCHSIQLAFFVCPQIHFVAAWDIRAIFFRFVRWKVNSARYFFPYLNLTSRKRNSIW